MGGCDPGAGSPQSREEVRANLLRKGTSSRFPELARSGEHLQGPYVTVLQGAVAHGAPAHMIWLSERPE